MKMRLLHLPMLGLTCIGIGFSASASPSEATLERSQAIQEFTQVQARDEMPSCGPGSITAHRHIAYYDATNVRERSCDKVWPSQINTTGFTHLILSSATIDPKNFEIHLMHPSDEETYKQFLALPGKVKKWIALGFGQTGCDCSDPAVARRTWAVLTSTEENRAAFANSLAKFLEKWHFNGVHIDWEWTHAMNRGGNDLANKQDLVDTIRKTRMTLTKETGLSVSLPAQEEILSRMNPQGLRPYVDWFNLVTYDLHGPWDSSDTRFGPYIKPHSDLKDINEALDRIWAFGIPPYMINLGVANYGRGFTVADNKCAWYGCKFTRGSTAGACTKSEGMLTMCELQRVIAEKKLKPKFIAGGAGMKEISWDNQWVGFDDRDTFGLKLDVANNRCLGGIALWAIDREICSGSIGSPNPGSSVIPSPSAPASSLAGSGLQSTSAASATQGPSLVSSAASVASSKDSSASHIATTPAKNTGSSPTASSGEATKSLSHKTAPAVESSHLSTPVAGSSKMITSGGEATTSAWTQINSLTSYMTVPSTSAISSQTSQTSIVRSQTTMGSTTLWPPVMSSVPMSTPMVIDSTTSWLSVPATVTSQVTSPKSLSGSQGTSTQPSTKESFPTSWYSTAVGSTTIWLPVITGATSSTPTVVGPSTLWLPVPPIANSQVSSPQPSSGSHDIQPQPSSKATTVTSWSSKVVGSTTVWLPVITDATSSTPSVIGSTSLWIPILPTISAQVPSSDSKTKNRDSSVTAPSDSQGPPSDQMSRSQAPSSQPPTGTSTRNPGGTSNTGFVTISSGSKVASTRQSASSTGNGGTSRPVVVNPTPTTNPNPSTVPLHPGDPDDFSDDDPDCVPKDCVAECIAWRVVTFFLFKRPVCPCIPHKCDKDHDSDTESDTDKDDPVPKPKISTVPNTNKKGCKMFGCGCGWMGLGFGPGCDGDNLLVPWVDPCGLFGCNPCPIFGCPPGIGPTEGPLGYEGHCLVAGGCDPCPKEICGTDPRCKIPGGCGPKPGPAPTQPTNRPKSCKVQDYTKVTERYVYCTEGFAVSELPSSLMIPRTSSTLQSSICATLFEATLTVCPGALRDMFTTTTRTGTKTLTSNGHACTRAPLSLDDDEGSNDVNDPMSSSIRFSSNTTHIPSSTRHAPTMAPSIPLQTTISNTWALPTPGWSVGTSSLSTPTLGISSLSTPSLGISSISVSTSTSQPSGKPGSMDRNGMWIIKATMFVEGQFSRFDWTLIDPNGNEAGNDYYGGDNFKDIRFQIQSEARPVQHSMPYNISLVVTDPMDYTKARATFWINQQVKGCEKYFDGLPCKVHMRTEDYTEKNKFEVESCWKNCKPKGATGSVRPADFNCQDLNDAPWFKVNSGWKRNFRCNVRGFDQ